MSVTTKRTTRGGGGQTESTHKEVQSMSIGLRAEVLALYKALLKAARHSKHATKTEQLVKESFRSDAFGVDRRDIAKVDWLLRRGWKQLEVLQTAARTNASQQQASSTSSTSSSKDR